jgi:hypothetical protein
MCKYDGRGDPAAGVKEQDDEALGLGVEVGMGRNVETPIIGCLVGCVAEVEVVGSGALPQGRHLVFVRFAGKGERLDERRPSKEGGSSRGGSRERLRRLGMLQRVLAGLAE